MWHGQHQHGQSVFIPVTWTRNLCSFERCCKYFIAIIYLTKILYYIFLRQIICSNIWQTFLVKVLVTKKLCQCERNQNWQIVDKELVQRRVLTDVIALLRQGCLKEQLCCNMLFSHSSATQMLVNKSFSILMLFPLWNYCQPILFFSLLLWSFKISSFLDDS